MGLKKKISGLISTGYKQISRKHRTLAKLPDGMNGFEALQKVDPSLANHMKAGFLESCADQYRRVYSRYDDNQIELSEPEFAEYLFQTGRGDRGED